MAGNPRPTSFVDPSVPDAAVPAEKVLTNFARHQEEARANRFLKGPIPLAWIREHVLGSADRLFLVLTAHADMRRSNELKVTADILRDAGIVDRKIAYRAINRLEASGSLSAYRHRGQRPVVRLLNRPGRK